MRRVISPALALVLFFIIQLQSADTQPVGECPALVRDAIQRVEQVCTGTGRNQICYGHFAMSAELRPEITDLLLSMPGDITEIYNVNRLQLLPLNLEEEQWGMALMRVQANLPDALPGQNVLFLLFGDVELTPERSTELVSAEQDIVPEPVSAFRLRSGVGAPLCDSAPPDGLLIQTPHGIGRVELTINGVDVNLGSTVFFTAHERGYLTVNTLEGSALVTTEDGESLALAGTQVQVPLDENLLPSAPPMLPEPYHLEGLAHLPLEALERPVEVHNPLSREEVAIIQQAVLDGTAESLLPEPTPEATEPAIPVCPGNSCNAQTPPANPNTGANPGGGQPANPPGQGQNPGGGGSPPANPPGQSGNPGGSPPGQGGNPNPGGGSPPDNPGQGGNPNPGGGSPPDNPGQGGNPNPGGGSPPDNPGQGGNPGGGPPATPPGQGGNPGGGPPGQGS